jgi:hypothetical protein
VTQSIFRVRIGRVAVLEVHPGLVLDRPRYRGERDCDSVLDLTIALRPNRSATDQFSSEAEAKDHCATGNVVWFNTKSKVYHFAGTRDYGKTKSGAYMCQSDADRVGRAAKNEKPPAH